MPMNQVRVFCICLGIKFSCNCGLCALHLQSHLTLPTIQLCRLKMRLRSYGWQPVELELVPVSSTPKPGLFTQRFHWEVLGGSPICSCKSPFWPPQTKAAPEGPPTEIIQLDQEFTLHLRNHDFHRKELKRGCLLFLSLFLLTEVPQGSSLLCLLSLSSILLTLTTSVY